MGTEMGKWKRKWTITIQASRFVTFLNEINQWLSNNELANSLKGFFFGQEKFHLFSPVNHKSTTKFLFLPSFHPIIDCDKSSRVVMVFKDLGCLFFFIRRQV